MLPSGSSMRVNEIASSVGYTDPRYFARVFFHLWGAPSPPVRGGNSSALAVPPSEGLGVAKAQDPRGLASGQELHHTVGRNAQTRQLMVLVVSNKWEHC